MAHQAPSEVMVCAQETAVIGLKAGSWLQLLLKYGHVDTVKQLRWILHMSASLHKTWAITTDIGLEK